MTKETKIGLLVGLTFIILFAIILSKKGPNNTRATSTINLADAGAPDSTRPLSHAPLNNAGKVDVEPMLPSPIATDRTSPSMVTMPEEQVGQAIPTEDQPIEPLPESVISRLNLPLIETEVPVGDEEPVDVDSTQLANSVVNSLNGATTVGPQPTVTEPSPFSNIGPASTPLTGLTTRPQPSIDTAPPVQTPAPPAKPTRIIAVHEVKPGESLGKIAAKYYQRSTPSRIEAIFNANRDKLDTVNSVKAKTKLNIPLLEGEFAGMFEEVDRLSPQPINGGGNTRGTGNAMTSNGANRDSTVRIPLPAGDRTAAGSEIDRRTTPRTALPERSTSPVQPVAPPVKFTWYEVRQKDTLSKIAKSQLGNEKAYRDIFRLNQDILPDQHKLKPGMKIRLPIKEKPAATVDAVPASLAIDPSAED